MILTGQVRSTLMLRARSCKLADLEAEYIHLRGETQADCDGCEAIDLWRTEPRGGINEIQRSVRTSDSNHLACHLECQTMELA